MATENIIGNLATSIEAVSRLAGRENRLGGTQHLKLEGPRVASP